MKTALFTSVSLATLFLSVNSYAQSNDVNSSPPPAPVPSQWSYSFDANGNAVATYPGTVLFPAFPTPTNPLSPAQGGAGLSANYETSVRNIPGAVLDGSTPTDAAIQTAIANAGTTNNILIDGPAFVANPAAITFPTGVHLVFRGAGEIVTAVGSVTSINMLGQGSGYTSIPTASVTGSATLGAPIMGLSQQSLTLGSVGAGCTPGAVVSLAGGTGTAAQLTVSACQVASATIAAGGTGGTAGAQTVTGITGFGVPFQASVTVSGGAITAVNSISVGGVYQTNPTNIAAEPVTGANLTGAQLNLTMGIGVYSASAPAVAITNFGAYTVLPGTSTVSLTGPISGATLATATYNIQSVPVTSGGSYSGTSVPPVTFSGGFPVTVPRAIAIGQAININSALSAPLKQIFGGYGHVAPMLAVQQIEDIWFGADPTGTVDSSIAEQIAAYAVPTIGGVLHSSAGTYIICDNILLKSNTILRGNGGATNWRACSAFIGGAPVAYTFPFTGLGNTMISNVNFQAPYSTAKIDQNIRVEGFKFDYSAMTTASGTPVIFRMTSGAKFQNNVSTSVASADAMLADDSYEVSGNRTYVSGQYGNTSHDQWEGSSNGNIHDNWGFAPTGATTAYYGILADGTDSKTSFGVTHDLLIESNHLYGFTQAGVFITAGSQASSVNRVRTLHNTIDCQLVSGASGITYSGFGSFNDVDDNTIANCNGASISGALNSGGAPGNMSIKLNHIVNPARATGASNSVIGTSGTYANISFNQIEAGSYDYLISASGANSFAYLTSGATGTAGRVIGGTNFNFIDDDSAGGTNIRYGNGGLKFSDTGGTARDIFTSSLSQLAFGNGVATGEFDNVASQINGLVVLGAATGASPQIKPSSTGDANTSLTVLGKGTSGVLNGFFVRTADPTTSDIPSGQCANWNNTTAVTYKLVCNVSGTLRSVSLN